MSWLHTTPLPLLASATILVLLAALELGRRLSRAFPVTEQQASAATAPILGLVALLLAFAFSMANERHAMRRAAAVQEANSIGTFWLRTSLLPEPTRSEVRVRVQRYVDLHVEHRLAGNDVGRTANLEAEGERLQRELWVLLSEDAAREPESRRVLLTVPALNAMIDDGATVIAAWENRVPGAIVVYLYLLAVVAGAMFGYRPMHERRNWISWCALTVVLAGVLTTLIDLDRPRGGLVQTEMETYVRLRAMVHQPAPDGVDATGDHTLVRAPS
jgi:hypothetical protein